MFTKGTKAALHSQLQQTGLVDKEALEKCSHRFPADHGTHSDTSMEVQPQKSALCGN